jgi:ubiquinone/menaquinone biosynthesis C-methylase UbiE
MTTRLHTCAVRDRDDIRTFFDALAGGYREAHGHAEQLLQRRLTLIRKLIDARNAGVLLDLGCGPGVHLFPLAAAFERVIGIDLSPRMIAVAADIGRTRWPDVRIELHAADAARLTCIAPLSVDVVLCVGALEHMPDQAAVLAEVARVLKPRGRFVCLTVNGASLWYRAVASGLGYDAKHLSTDRFLDAVELRALLSQARLEIRALGYWKFIAKGDMPQWIARPLELLEYVGRICAPSTFRGGLYASAEKLQDDDLAARVQR